MISSALENSFFWRKSQPLSANWTLRCSRADSKKVQSPEESAQKMKYQKSLSIGPALIAPRKPTNKKMNKK